MKGVIRGTSKPPRIVLYGPQGIGKSTFGSDAPAPIFVTTEDGVDNIPVDQFPVPATWGELQTNVQQVATDKHDYQTIVLDTLNNAVDLAAEMICETLFSGQWVAKKGTGGFMSYGQGWKATAEEVAKLLKVLDQCRTRGMTIILLAHAGLHNVKDPLEGEYTKFAPNIDKGPWAKVSGWADIVLRADYEYAVVRGKGETKGRAVGNQTRIVHTVGSAAEDAKCRVGYELPDTIHLSFSDFQSKLGSGASTLAEIENLWGLLTPDEQKKTMDWLGVKKVEDAPLTKCRQLLNKLREKQGREAEKEEAA